MEIRRPPTSWRGQVSIYLVRHAHAGDRHRWDTDQDERPLSDRGRAQAKGLVAFLRDRGIEHIVSSPTTRCTDTVAPLAAALGLEVTSSPALYEGSSVDGALAIVDQHLTDGTVLCSHGDVIPDLLRALRRRGLEGNGLGACEKGSTWELTVADGSIVAATYHPSPD